MAWRGWFRTIVFFISVLLLVGCAAQQKVVEPAPTAEGPLANNTQAATPEPELPATEPAAAATAATSTTVPPAATSTTVPPAATSTTVPPAEPTTAVEPTTQADAGKANADVLYVIARQESENSWHFTVTVEHPDTGWDDYADGWDVVLPDGPVVKPDPDSPFTRLLLHPHETEQPFTRTQGGVVIPAGINEITVRAHDIVDGFGGREITLDLMSTSGTDYEVQRLQQ